MFSFFKKKLFNKNQPAAEENQPLDDATNTESAPAPTAAPAPATDIAATTTELAAEPDQVPASAAADADLDQSQVAATDSSSSTAATTEPDTVQPEPELTQAKPAVSRIDWLQRLKQGMKKTSFGFSNIFSRGKIDDELYQELEDALLIADTGVSTTEHLLQQLKQEIKRTKIQQPAEIKQLLLDIISQHLQPLERNLVIGEHTPSVLMVVGVNGAGKTTSIGKLTKHLSKANASVLLAAADTFRAAAKEQLGVWADRTTVDIISQNGADPATVSFDAVKAGVARQKDVVIIDTAGRLPTQLHLMEELKKVKRVIAKAQDTAPHEILLVLDGNTGQNALNQVKIFHQAIGLTGLIVTKLDGTAKGGVIAAIAQECPIPIYFIGIGESVDDLQTFKAAEFAQAMLD